MSFEAWLLFVLTDTVLCFTPGPAVLLVVSTALTMGAGPGLRASFGILAMNVMYFALSATGIGAILLASWELFVLIKWIGAVYLVWLGLSMLFARRGDAAVVATTDSEDRRNARAFTRGLITQGSNPKALVFFSAIVPQFIDPHADVVFQIALLGLTSTLIELVALSIYVAACYQARRAVRQDSLVSALNRAGGALLIGAGAGLASLRR
jgi:homoserine/homoserine lactone efflux protein